MKRSRSRPIEASKGQVSTGLLSTDVQKECVPGCEEMIGSFANRLETIFLIVLNDITAKCRVIEKHGRF